MACVRDTRARIVVNRHASDLGCFCVSQPSEFALWDIDNKSARVFYTHRQALKTPMLCMFVTYPNLVSQIVQGMIRMLCTTGRFLARLRVRVRERVRVRARVRMRIGVRVRVRAKVRVRARMKVRVRVRARLRVG